LRSKETAGVGWSKTPDRRAPFARREALLRGEETPEVPAFRFERGGKRKGERGMEKEGAFPNIARGQA
jgi:hypothetical protein